MASISIDTNRPPPKPAAYSTVAPPPKIIHLTIFKATRFDQIGGSLLTDLMVPGEGGLNDGYS